MFYLSQVKSRSKMVKNIEGGIYLYAYRKLLKFIFGNETSDLISISYRDFFYIINNVVMVAGSRGSGVWI